MSLIFRCIRLEGFMIGNQGGTFDAFRHEMEGWLEAGQVCAHEAMTEELEKAPAAFIAMLQGRNTGKSVVRVASGRT